MNFWRPVSLILLREVQALRRDLRLSHRMIIQQGEKLMSALGDLKPMLDGIGTDVTAISAGVTALQAKLASLQNGTSILNAADQATLDAAVKESNDLKVALDGVVANLNSAATTVPSSGSGSATPPVSGTAPVTVSDPTAGQPTTITAPATQQAPSGAAPGSAGDGATPQTPASDTNGGVHPTLPKPTPS